MKLYGYWRSGTSYRVRLALALKGIEVETIPVNLRAGAHHEDSYKVENPQGMVPTLVLEDGTRLGQSPAIIDYLEDVFPEPPLLPRDPKDRAHVRHLAFIVGCDIHPLNNLRILKYVKNDLDQPQEEVDKWISRWITDGFTAFETLLEADDQRGEFCFGGKPGLAECYLLPQIYSARRFGVPLGAFPEILKVETAAMKLEAVQKAVPEAQADADPDA